MMVTFASQQPGQGSVTWAEAFPGPTPPPSPATASGPPEVFAGPYNPDGAHYIYRLAMTVQPGAVRRSAARCPVAFSCGAPFANGARTSILHIGTYYNYTVSASGVTSSPFTFQAMPRPPTIAQPWVAKFLVFGGLLGLRVDRTDGRPYPRAFTLYGRSCVLR
jgi:hypothetical protein